MLSTMYGELADGIDQIDDLIEKDAQMYVALRSLTEDESFNLVSNCPSGRGPEAWKRLHKR